MSYRRKQQGEMGGSQEEFRHGLLTFEEELQLAKEREAGDVARQNISMHVLRHRNFYAQALEIPDEELERMIDAFAEQNAIERSMTLSTVFDRKEMLPKIDLAKECREKLMTLLDEESVREGLRENLYALHRGDHAKNTLVKMNHRLAANFAYRKQEMLRAHDINDFMQELHFALVRAAMDFDYREERPFATYATWWMRYVFRLLSRGNFMQRKTVDLEVQDSEGEVFNGLEAIPDQREPAPEEAQRERDSVASMQGYLRRLDWRERMALEWRFGFKDGIEYSLEKIGEKLGISKERVRQLLNRGVFKLRKRMLAEEPEIAERMSTLPVAEKTMYAKNRGAY